MDGWLEEQMEKDKSRIDHWLERNSRNGVLAGRVISEAIACVKPKP